MITERLQLKPIKADDLEFLYELDNHKSVNRYRASDTRTVDFCVSQIEKWTHNYTDEILTVHVVSLLETGHKIGLVLLVQSLEGEITLGYRFLEDYWHKGYAKEAVTFLLDAHFKRSSQCIMADTHSENTASIHLLIKLGFKELTDQSTGNCKIYKLSKTSFALA